MVDTTSSAPLNFSGVIEVKKDHQLLGIILRASYNLPGIHFLTPGELSQQLAFMRHPNGKVIAPHVHNSVTRQVTQTQEALFVRRGRLRVDFYDACRQYYQSYEVRSGDVVLLIHGGHGFEILEETEFVEVKQGPYAGDNDKTRFIGIRAGDVKLAEDDVKLAE